MAQPDKLTPGDPRVIAQEVLARREAAETDPIGKFMFGLFGKMVDVGTLTSTSADRFMGTFSKDPSRKVSLAIDHYDYKKVSLHVSGTDKSVDPVYCLALWGKTHGHLAIANNERHNPSAQEIADMMREEVEGTLIPQTVSVMRDRRQNPAQSSNIFWIQF